MLVYLASLSGWLQPAAVSYAPACLTEMLLYTYIYIYIYVYIYVLQFFVVAACKQARMHMETFVPCEFVCLCSDCPTGYTVFSSIL